MVPLSMAAKKYYVTSPDNTHRTGDIWRGLPTMSLLGSMSTCPGLVITPACDLAHGKSSTITYLPVCSLSTYLSSPNGYTILRPAIVELLTDKLRLSAASELLARGRIPDSNVIEEISAYMAAAQLTEPIKSRLMAGLDAMRLLREHKKEAAKAIKQCIHPKKWKELREGLVRNSYADDIHFLPPESPVGPWSAITEPSLVLMRYPITIPRTLLDLANHDDEDWELARLQIPAVFNSMPERPLKVLRLHKDFLSDLLTRFARLYVRIGSPDFTNEAIDSLSDLMMMNGDWE